MKVSSATYTIPVVTFSGYDMGAPLIQAALKNQGWFATVIPQTGPASTSVLGNLFTGVAGFTSGRYPDATLKVTMKRSGGGDFEESDARLAVVAAAQSVGVQLQAFAAWTVETVAALVSANEQMQGSVVRPNAPGGVKHYWQKKEEEAEQSVRDEIPTLPDFGWVLPVAAVGLGLLLVSKLGRRRR